MVRKLSIIASICCLFPLSSFANNPQIFVGDYTTLQNKNAPLLAINQSENSWTYPTLPDLPTDNHGVYMSGAGCTSKFCAAVGAYHSNEYHPVLAVSFNQGAQWSYVSKLGDKDNISGQLYGLSCNNNLCVAVGADYQKGFHPYMPLLSVGHGSEWTIPSSVITNLPSDLVEGEFGEVICNNSFCMAAGEYDTKAGPAYPMVAVSEDKDKVQWTFSSGLSSLLPKDVKDTYIAGLNCTDKVCVISGLYRLTSDKQVAFLATSYDKGKTWTYPADIVSKLPDSEDSRLDRVSCFKEDCVAVGSYHPNNDRSILNYTPLVAISHNSGKNWSYIKNIDSKLPANYKSAELWNVGCNEKICLAGGQIDSSKQIPFLIYSKDQGETWSLLNELPKDYVAGGNFTGGINCNETSCFAVGDYRNSERFAPLLVTTQDANTWSFPSSVIDNLPQDFLSGFSFHTDSYSNGLMAKKKHRV